MERRGHLRDRLLQGSAAALILCATAMPAPAQGPMPPGTTGADGAGSASTTHNVPFPAPFGALTLFTLGGTLLAGVVVGIGLASLRGGSRLRVPSLAMGGFASPTRAQPVPRSVDADVALRPEMPAPALPPVVARVATAPGPALDGWIGKLVDGPRFGPRIVGVVATPGCDGADAIARIAVYARACGYDVVLIDAGHATAALADALDRRLARHPRAVDPFGADPRITLVDVADLGLAGDRPDPQLSRDALAALSGGADIVLVVLGADGTSPGALRSILDDVVALRGESDSDDQVATLCDATQRGGSTITGQVIVDPA